MANDIPNSRVIQDPFSQVLKENVFDARVVTKIHEKADTDTTKVAAHHTIGISGNQASAGNHAHNGSDSVQLLGGVSITGSRGGNAAVTSIVAALVLLGATDNTTP